MGPGPGADQAVRHRPREAPASATGPFGVGAGPPSIEGGVEDLQPPVEQGGVEGRDGMQPAVVLDEGVSVLEGRAEEQPNPEVGEGEGVGCQSTLAMVSKYTWKRSSWAISR